MLLAAMLLAGLPQEALLADRKLGNGLASCLPQRVDRKARVLLTFNRRNVGREIHVEHEASGRSFDLVLTGKTGTEWAGGQGQLYSRFAPRARDRGR